MAVKRQVWFFIFVAIVATSFGVLRLMQPQNHSSLPRLPSVYFYDKSGKKVSLDDFKGKVVLVNLWATWCPPCVAELPSLERLQKALPKDKFMVIAVSMDNPPFKAVADFLKKNHIQNLDLYWDKDRQMPLKWTYAGLPTSFLLDRDGNTIARYDGPYIWDQPPAMEAIKAQLK